MKSLTNRIKLVYRDLGSVLDSPESFGLGERAPMPLVNALTAMRQILREELVELNQWAPDDDLAAELSQDADKPASSIDAKRRRTG
ncbi:MAG TPA: hypothetical protein VNV88_16005 [Candidatus Solibacter sp.]|jgi:hypothetical protein|nr:hypothetical protein [Candidatus Solibacter sp.]